MHTIYICKASFLSIHLLISYLRLHSYLDDYKQDFFDYWVHVLFKLAFLFSMELEPEVELLHNMC